MGFNFLHHWLETILGDTLRRAMGRANLTSGALNGTTWRFPAFAVLDGVDNGVETPASGSWPDTSITGGANMKGGKWIETKWRTKPQFLAAPLHYRRLLLLQERTHDGLISRACRQPLAQHARTLLALLG